MLASTRLAAHPPRASRSAAPPNGRLVARDGAPRELSAEETADEPGQASVPGGDRTPAAPGEAPVPAPHPGTTPSEPGDAPASGAGERNRPPPVDR